MLFCALALVACAPSASHSTPPTPTIKPIATITARIPLDQSSQNYNIAVTDTAVWVHDWDSGNLLRIDPNTNKVVATIPVGTGPGHVAIEAGFVWVLSKDDSVVSKVDPQTNQVVDTIQLPPPYTFLAVSPGAVWVASVGQGKVSKIDARTDKVIATISIPDGPGWMSYGAGSLWVCGNDHGSVLRIDPATNHILKRFDVGSQQGRQCAAIVALDSTVWAEVLIAGIPGAYMYRINPASNTLNNAAYTMPDFLSYGVAADAQGAWVSDSQGMYRVDPQTDQVVGKLAEPGAVAVAVGDGSVWLATSDPNTNSGTLLRLTPAS